LRVVPPELFAHAVGEPVALLLQVLAPSRPLAQLDDGRILGRQLNARRFPCPRAVSPSMHARASAVRIVVDSSLRARKGTKSGPGVPRARSESFPERCGKRPGNRISHGQWRF
jgi:hypothetical protein